MLEERKMSGYIELRNYVLRRACAGPVLGGRKMGRPHTHRQTGDGRPNDLYKSVVNFVVFHFIRNRFLSILGRYSYCILLYSVCHQPLFLSSSSDPVSINLSWSTRLDKSERKESSRSPPNTIDVFFFFWSGRTRQYWAICRRRGV
jgi:hypothetical protein